MKPRRPSFHRRVRCRNCGTDFALISGCPTCRRSRKPRALDMTREPDPGQLRYNASLIRETQDEPEPEF
jgi:predicted amidophosphoribosyltransferase